MSHEHGRGQWARLLDELSERGGVVEDGLTEAETLNAEHRFRFCFPPDLRALLQTGLPVSEHFPDWRDGADEKLRNDLQWPLEGMQLDIRHNTFWLSEWGPRPEALEAAFQIAAQAVAAAPLLVPLCGHRYIPAEPARAGNPVFSVYQTDIIFYGYDLLSYFAAEFGGAEGSRPLSTRGLSASGVKSLAERLHCR